MSKIESLVNELVAMGVIWTGDKERAASDLSCKGQWGTGIVDDSAVWDRAISTASAHGMTGSVDDSDGIPYFSIRA